MFVGRGGHRIRNGRGEYGPERGAQISSAELPEERSLPRPKGLQRVGRLRLRCTYIAACISRDASIWKFTIRSSGCYDDLEVYCKIVWML